MKRTDSNESGLDLGAYFLFEALLTGTVYLWDFAHIITHLNWQKNELLPQSLQR